MEQFCPLVVGLFEVEVVCLIRQFDNLDALLEIGSICSQMGTDLPLQGLLLGPISGLEVGPHLLVDLAIQLVLVGLTHSAAEFAEFPIEIVYRLAVKFQFIFLTCLECCDNPGQRLVVEVDGFNHIGEFDCQVIFTQVALTTLPLKVRTAVIDMSAPTLLDVLFCRDGTAAIATGDQPHIGKRMFLFSWLVVPAKCRLGLFKQFTGDERFMCALMQLSIPTKIAVIQRVLEDFSQASWCEGTSRFTVAHTHVIGEVASCFNE